MTTRLTWPNSSGFWYSGGRFYFVRYTIGSGYQVRYCHNRDVAGYVSQSEFSTSLKELFTWFPCTITIHDEREVPKLTPGIETGTFNSTLQDVLRATTDLRGVKLPIEVVMSNEEKEAVTLLTKVCEHVKEEVNSLQSEGTPLSLLDEIPGLVEWWAKNKPKSEREEKLEKIEDIICRNKEFTVEQQAIEILNLLEP